MPACFLAGTQDNLQYSSGIKSYKSSDVDASLKLLA
jgi:hypothetical protein